MRSEIGTQTCHKEIEELRKVFNQSADEAEHFLESLPETLFNQKPEPGTWSVAECFEHLNRTGKFVTAAIETSISNGLKNNKTGKPPFKYGWFNNLFIRYMKPKAPIKMSAPKLYRPDIHSNYDKTVTLATYTKLQEQYCTLLEMANELDLKRIKVRSPAVPVLRLSLGACFHAMAAHQERHIEQAKRIYQKLQMVT